MEHVSVLRMMVGTGCCVCLSDTLQAAVVFGCDWPRSCRRKGRPAYSSVIKLEATLSGERPADLCHATCYPPVIRRNTVSITCQESGTYRVLETGYIYIYIRVYIIKHNNILSDIAQHNSQCPSITFAYLGN
jgi:hypothetical protein